MSRHRNVRNMIAEEDYYYDDDYYDDYDDYGDYAVAPSASAASSSKKKKKKNKKKEPATPTTSHTATAATTAATTTQQTTPSLTSTGKTGTTSSSSIGGGLTVLPATSKGTAKLTTTHTTASTTTTFSSASQQQQQQQQAAQPQAPPVPPILLVQKAKPTLTAVILGHVDAGKSTLTGRLLWATSQQQSKGASSASSSIPRGRPPTNYAWLLDEDEQERQHGVTMEVATKVLVTPRYEIVVNDAPGHADYVPSMITGTAAADVAVVVVDATDFGTSFGAGQLREHLFLAKGLGISQCIVAINKMDLLAWSADAYHEMVTQLTSFLESNLGYSPSKLHFLPISGLTGVNVVNVPTVEDHPELMSWYKGPTLWQTLDLLEAPHVGPKLLEKPLRILVTDVMGEVGKGVAVRGKVASGWLEQGQALQVSPVMDETSIYKMTRIQQIELAPSDDNDDNDDDKKERNKYAVAGELLDLVLTGMDVNRISTGNILARPGQLPPLTTRCRCKIFVLEGVTVPIIRGAQAILHMHYLDVPCHLSALRHTIKPTDGSSILKERPRVLTAKTQAVVEITLHCPIAMEAFSDCRALGRFVLRRSGASIAVGRVEQVLE